MDIAGVYKNFIIFQHSSSALTPVNKRTKSCQVFENVLCFQRIFGFAAKAQQLPNIQPREVLQMKKAYSSKKIGGYLLAFFLLFGIITVASSSAQAQYPWGYGRDRQTDQDRDYRRDRDRDRDYRRGNYGYGYENARQQGYSYGLNVGAADAQRGQNYDPQRSHYWKDASYGYDSSYGNRGQYKQVFRSAFEQGYREGYQRYGSNRRGRGGSSRFPWPW